MKNKIRTPEAFSLSPEELNASPSEASVKRQPRTIPLDERITITSSENDDFDNYETLPSELGLPSPPIRRLRLGTVFIGAFSLLISLAIGLWADRLIRDLFNRADWLGWLAILTATIAAISFFIIVARELVALIRLASSEKIHAQAKVAYENDDTKQAQAVVSELKLLLASHPDTAAARNKLDSIAGDIIDGRDLLHIAERELLAPLDRRAQKLVLDAAKRVSIVTAVSPRALVDIAYVLFETSRLIRRLSELYCGRPGVLGFFRLIRNVMAHLAVTGTMALGDGLVHQIVGHGLAARLSARLGEGVVNGMLTARIGLAAMEAIRPLEFHAVTRPGVSDFVKALSQFAKKHEKNT